MIATNYQLINPKTKEKMKATMKRIKNIILALWCQITRKGAFKNFFITGNAFGCLSQYSHISRRSMTPKIMYSTKQSALKAAEKMGAKHGVHFSVYKCAWCDGWHIGKNAQNKYEKQDEPKSPDASKPKIRNIEAFRDRLKPEYAHKYAPSAVTRRPWGGESHTRLMLELEPTAFPEGKVMVGIEAGYVGTSIEGKPEDWVKCNCSGLVLDKSFFVEETRMIVYEMHFDEKAVKADSPYRYLVSGPGSGEYTVLICTMGPNAKVVYEESFSCK